MQHKNSGTHTLRKEKHQLEFNCSFSLSDISKSHWIVVPTWPQDYNPACFHFSSLSNSYPTRKAIQHILKFTHTCQAHSYPSTYCTCCFSSAGSTIPHLHHLPDSLTHFQVSVWLPCSRNWPWTRHNWCSRHSLTPTTRSLTTRTPTLSACLTTRLGAVWAAGIPVGSWYPCGFVFHCPIQSRGILSVV